MNSSTEFLAGLVKTGKQSFEIAVAMGQDYAPKVLAEIDGEFRLFIYDGFAESLINLVEVALDEGPVVMFALTSDTYGVKESAINDPRYTPGSLQSFFEAGDPNVGEALVVEVVTLDDAVQFTCPYVRKDGKIQWRKHYARQGVTHESMAIMRGALAMSAEQSQAPLN